MKKLLFMAAFLLPMTAKAQLGSLVENPANGDKGNIVRVWQGKEKVLSYGRVGLNQHTVNAFCLSDYSNIYLSAPPSPVLTIQCADLSAILSAQVNPRLTDIRDMTIVDDYVFFCGDAVDTTYPPTSTDVIGWFKLADFSSSTINLNYFEIPQNTASYLKRIAAYPSGQGGFTVLALGEDINFTDYIFEIKNVTATTSLSVDYRQFSASSYWVKEAADDILVTDEDVFVVGNNRTTANGFQLCIRRTDRNIGITSPQFNLRYDYIASGYEVNANTHSTLTEDNIIATSYVHAPTSTSFTTRLRLIDPTSMDMINSQEYLIDEKWEPEGIVYVDIPRKLVILQENADQWFFTELDPFNNHQYMANIMYHQDQEFHSLDSDHKDMFVSAGIKHFLYFHNLFMPLPTSTRCPENKDVMIDPIDNIVKSWIYIPFAPPQIFVNEVQVQVPVSGINSVPFCDSPLNLK